MITTERSTESLIQILDVQFEEAWVSTPEDRFGVLSFPINKLSFLGWLSQQSSQQSSQEFSQENTQRSFYWKSRDGSRERAGAGVLHELSGNDQTAHKQALDQIQNQTTSSSISYFGGGGFNQRSYDVSDSEWEGVPSFLYILPNYELISQGDTAQFKLYFKKEDDKKSAVLEQLKKTIKTVSFNDSFLQSSQTDCQEEALTPNKETWTENIRDLKTRFSESSLSKCILARQVKRTMTQEINPFFICDRLSQESPNTFTYLIQFSKDQVFLGHSPESLFSLKQNNLKTEALAGTFKRGKTEEEDKKNEETLLSLSKEKTEHDIVSTYLEKQLEGLCDDYEKSEDLSVIKLSHIQHLCRYFSGQKKDAVSTYDILTSLHPTPAVCGEPKESAQEFIEKTEPFNRGWYSGYIGEIGGGEVDFSVAIRCSLCCGNVQYLYSGAGIVEQSNADLEWDELGEKVLCFGAASQ